MQPCCNSLSFFFFLLTQSRKDQQDQRFVSHTLPAYFSLTKLKRENKKINTFFHAAIGLF